MARKQEKYTVKKFSKISIGLSSPEAILGISKGEVLKPETINYRTHKPERDGLFCERIFGPVKDYECACGKYKRIRYKGIVCDRCGVEVTEKKVRRDRVGHINLVVPVAHIWYFRSLPNKMGYLLGLPSKKLDMIIYYERYVVIQPGIAKNVEGEPLQKMDFLTEEEYLDIAETLPQENQYLEDSDPNKFIAKIASDWYKPDGLCVITPEKLEAFVLELPVKKIFGVGKVTGAKLQQMGIETCADLRTLSMAQLVDRFGRFGKRLYELSRGVDDRPVKTSRERKSISVEHTFAADLPDLDSCIEKLPAMLSELALRFQKHAQQREIAGAVMKLKFSDFTQTTVEQSAAECPLVLYQHLCHEAWFRGKKKVRLIGVGYRLQAKNQQQAVQLKLLE